MDGKQGTGTARLRPSPLSTSRPARRPAGAVSGAPAVPSPPPGGRQRRAGASGTRWDVKPASTKHLWASRTSGGMSTGALHPRPG